MKTLSRSGYQSLVLSLPFLMACDLTPPSDATVVREAGRITQVLLKESFERDTLLSSTAPTDSFGWRAFIWDYGTPVIGASGRNVAAVIMSDTQMGKASDGNKALYFYGREGASIHSIYLFTHSYDLSEFDRVDISFDYLLFGLNDGDDTVSEFLKLEVCADTAENCGAGASVNNSKLQSASWKTLFEGDDRITTLNGKNHQRTDWSSIGVRLNIADFPKKDTFTLRLSARMSDGFVANDLTKSLVDGVAVDNIQVAASRSQDPGEQGPDDPNCTPEVSIMERSSCYELPFEHLDNPLGL